MSLSRRQTIWKRLAGYWPQVVRRLTQLTALAFIIYISVGGAWRNFKRAHNQQRIVELLTDETTGALYGANEWFLSLFGEPYRASFDFLGLPWASTLFGVESLDPVLVLSHIVSTGSVSASVLVGLLIPVGLAVLFGKVFCSHICPMRLVFEVGEWTRMGLERLGVPLADFQSDNRLGGWVLLGGLVATTFAGPAVWLFILPYVGLAASIFLFISTSAVTLLAAVVAFWFLVEVMLAPGFFCRNLCPTGFVLEVASRFRIWQLDFDEQEIECPKNCRVCEMTCPYGISSRDGNYDFGCDNCGRCAQACPLEKLERKVRKPRGLGHKIGPLIAAFLVFLAPALSSAHHNKGLPHYGYFENYPQVPTEDYVIIDGRWEMGAVVFNFQGYDSRDSSDTPNDVKLYLYIYDLQEDRNYTDEVDFEIQKDGETIAEYLRTEVDEEAVYSTREQLPESGDYEVVARLKTDPPTELRLPFSVDLDDGINWWVVSGAGAPVLIVFGLAVFGQRKRRRRGRKS